MFKKRFVLLFATLLIITQVSCSQQMNTTNSQKLSIVNTPTPTVAVKQPEDDDLVTDEIFDKEKHKGELQVRFFNLEGDSKTGESMLITTPDGINMLIDSGIKKVGPQLVEYLKRLEIKKLDYIVASHFHSDHIGGMAAVIDEFDIAEVMICEMPFNSNLKQELDEAIYRKNGNVRYLKSGDVFNLGDEVEVEVLSPAPDMVIPDGVIPEKVESNTFVNNHSIVMIMTYKNNSFLFPGDIYEECEKGLIEVFPRKLDVDVLKVPHHGTDTSSSNEFIKAVSPKIAVICTNVGFSKHRYDKYRAEGSDVYITVIDGNVLVLSDGESISVITEKDRMGSFLK